MGGAPQFIKPVEGQQHTGRQFAMVDGIRSAKAGQRFLQRAGQMLCNIEVVLFERQFQRGENAVAQPPIVRSHAFPHPWS